MSREGKLGHRCVLQPIKVRRGLKDIWLLCSRKLKSYKKKIIDMQFSDLKIPEEIAKNTVGDL